VLGLLFRGRQPTQTEQGYTFVTPIEDVFQDIKDKSKGKILDIRVLQE
jgi:hypothetical protein